MIEQLDPDTRARIDTQNPMRVQRAWEVQKATGRGLAAWQDDTPPPTQIAPVETPPPAVVEPTPPPAIAEPTPTRDVALPRPTIKVGRRLCCFLVFVV